MQNKPHLALDGYKASHKFQYPEGTQYVYSNLTARSAGHAKVSRFFDNKAVFVGLQGFIQEFLIEDWNAGFFKRPKDEVVAEYKRRMDTYLGPDSVPVDHIADLHDLGYLPLEIKALPEGSRVDIRVPFLTIINTDPRFFWLTNYIETILSAELWQPITNATVAYEFRRLLNHYVELTGSDKDFADWQLHDFSMRGMPGLHAAARSGMAHLMVAGHGTDTLPAIDYIEEYYFADATKELIGGSVPATEHSVMCMGGKDDGELATFKRLITETYPSGIVSIVSDTWDFWNVITNTALLLKDDILARKENALGQAKVVFRPDSGDPVKIVAGLRVLEVGPRLPDGMSGYDAEDKYDVVNYEGRYYEFKGDNTDVLTLTREVPAHVVAGAVECLWNIFGGTITGAPSGKGYKTLNQRVGLIYGDSITLERMEEILKRLAAKGFSAGNVVFGIGSYAYQYNTRDTLGMAVKATYGVVNGEGRELFKDPVTDSGTKKSAKGLLRVEQMGDRFALYDGVNWYLEGGELCRVFRNGLAFNLQSYAEIVARLK
jgi:nicotinamide phosphoribosyltransferase